MKYTLLFFLPLLLTSCAVQHYQEGLIVKHDDYLNTKVATMVREYRTVETLRNNLNSLYRYRVNVHWSKNMTEDILHANLTLIEFQEAVPDLDQRFFIKIDGQIIEVPFDEVSSTLQIAGTDDQVSIKKFHTGHLIMDRGIQNQLVNAEQVSFRMYAGLATYTCDLPPAEVQLLKRMIRAN